MFSYLALLSGVIVFLYSYRLFKKESDDRVSMQVYGLGAFFGINTSMISLILLTAPYIKQLWLFPRPDLGILFLIVTVLCLTAFWLLVPAFKKENKKN